MRNGDGHDRGLDGWLIGELRSHARPRRLGELLLDGGEAPPDLVCRVETVERQLADVQVKLHRTERRLQGVSVHHAPAHTRFVPNARGYEIVEADGPPPRAGEDVVVDEQGYRVLRVGRSPFPFDRRPCVFLVAA